MRLLTSWFAILLCLGAGTASAQSATATLGGIITDPSGAVVPGVAVTILKLSSGAERQTATGDTGAFTVTLLPPGRYLLRAVRQGFAPLEVPDIVLNVGDQVVLHLRLDLEKIGESLTVTATAPRVSTSAAVSTVVDQQFIENIPLNGRSFQSLIALTPGVVLVPSFGANQAGQFSVNGQRASGTAFTIDGVSANFAAAPGGTGGSSNTGNLPALTTFGTTQSLASVDALLEFNVQTSGYSAEYGRQTGGQISIITRSGSNTLHGGLFDYVRNDAFDARDFFNTTGPKPAERQNDFGGTLGGPVIVPGLFDGHNRTFYFFSYEGLRLRQPQYSLTNVPTVALRQQARAGVKPILDSFPLPNGRDLGNGLAEFGSGYSDPSRLDATSVRVDHTTGRLTLFGRYSIAPSETSTRAAGQNLASITVSQLRSQTITVGATTTFSPGMANELRANYSGNRSIRKAQVDEFGGAVPVPIDALIPSQYISESAIATAQLTNWPGRTSTGNPAAGPVIPDAVDTSQAQVNIVDNFLWTFRAHQLKFGVDYRRLTPISAVNTYQLSTFFGSSAEVAAGVAGIGSVGSNTMLQPSFLNLSAYAQDKWQVSPRLTLDLGLRWDINPASSDRGGNTPLAVTQISNLATMQLAPLGTERWRTTYDNFGPRLGLAYRLFDRPARETVVRGGFGVYFDGDLDAGSAGFNSTYPFFINRSLTNVGYPLNPTQLAPPVIPFPNAITPPYGTFTVIDPDLKLPYTLQWNVAVGQALGRSQAFSVSYVGAAGRRLLHSDQIVLNTINPNFTTINLYRNLASSDYHSLQMQFQRRLSQGLQALASYTWAHAMDDDSSGSTQRVAQRGNADFDIRHVFAAAVTYDPPSPGSNPLRTIFGGWSIDATGRAQSALPLDIIATTITNPADGLRLNIRPNVIPGVPFYVDGPYPGGRAINNAAPTAEQLAAAGCQATGPAKGPFCTPLAGQSGNLGRNVLRAFGAWQVDLALRREFGLFRNVKLQFRAEAFNVFNNPNFGQVQTTLSAANFGQATGMLNRQLGGVSQLYQIGGPRSGQFALKLNF